jgi:hypothetical protein
MEELPLLFDPETLQRPYRLMMMSYPKLPLNLLYIK